MDCTTTSDDLSRSTQVRFNVNASMAERERRTGSLVLDFKMTLETDPTGGKLDLNGTAELKGTDEHIEQALQPSPDSNVPPVFMTIYKEVYALTYMLASTLNLPCPSPGLLNTAQLESKRLAAPPIVA